MRVCFVSVCPTKHMTRVCVREGGSVGLLRETGHCVHNGSAACLGVYPAPHPGGSVCVVWGSGFLILPYCSSTVAWLCGLQLLQWGPMVEVFVPACPLQRLQLRSPGLVVDMLGHAVCWECCVSAERVKQWAIMWQAACLGLPGSGTCPCKAGAS